MHGAAGDTVVVIGRNWGIDSHLDPEVADIHGLETVVGTLGGIGFKANDHTNVLHDLNASAVLLHVEIPPGLEAG